jgi:hypothetical protein
MIEDYRCRNLCLNFRKEETAMRFRIISISIITLLFPFTLFAQTAEIGAIKALPEKDGSLKIEVYDVAVSEMMGRDIRFCFSLYQGKTTIEGSLRQIDKKAVGFEPAYWKGLAFQCTYSREFLTSIKKSDTTIQGIFFVLDSELEESIGGKTIEVTTGSKEASKTKEEKTKLDNSTFNIIIEYKVAQGIQIVIQKGTLSYSHVSEIKSIDNNPVSGNTYAEYTTSEYALTSEDYKAFLDCFKANNWQALLYDYGVGKLDRNYPTSIRMRDSKGDKTVTYREGAVPTDKPPQSFFSIAECLVSIADSIAKRK